MELSGDKVTYRRIDHVERDLAQGRRFVQSLDATTPTQLSGSAPMIWDLLEEHDSIEALAAVLEERYSDSRDVLADGVTSAIASLLDAGLVEEAR